MVLNELVERLFYLAPNMIIYAPLIFLIFILIFTFIKVCITSIFGLDLKHFAVLFPRAVSARANCFTLHKVLC